MQRALLCAAMVALSCGLALGQAQYKVLYNFQGAQSGDGALPGGLVSDRAGNLYGVTEVGGIAGGCDGGGCGVVYELSPNPDGTWSETVLHAFCAGGIPCVDGASPNAGLVLDPAGNLYVSNSKNNTVTEIPVGGDSPVTYASGLSNPQGLAFDSAGNLYVANTKNNTVSKVTPAGVVSTFSECMVWVVSSSAQKSMNVPPISTPMRQLMPVPSLRPPSCVRCRRCGPG